VEFEAVSDPLLEMDRFREEAERAGIPLPEAMTLATVDAEGRPRARVVLLKGRRERELHFFTNYESDKGRELDLHPEAAVCIHYASLEIQVRVEGNVSRLSEAQSDEYFRTRPRESQLGAWASDQSAPVASRDALEHSLSLIRQRFEGVEVPRPPHWGGYRLVAERVELWLGRQGRLHDRARYVFEKGVWGCTRLQP
jgi:pyridoxamine 5'-phosphate oxidase